MSDSQTTPGSGHTVQISDIAERTGYSLATVSKVLNGRSDVAAGTRQIIEEALRDSGYTKRISTTKNRKLIEAVFQNFDNIWSLEMLRGIVHEASAHEMSVVTTESGDRSHPDSRWVEGVLRRQPLGVVLVFSNLTESEKSRLQAFNIDYVTLDPAGDPSPDNLSVQADNWTGGLIATRHLLSLGHTRIGIITGPNSMLCSKAQLDGYKAALDEHDIPFDPDLVREGDFSTDGGYLQGLSLLKNSAKRPGFARTVQNGCLGSLGRHADGYGGNKPFQRKKAPCRALEGGRYKIRTCDPFRVREVRYLCANRPSYSPCQLTSSTMRGGYESRTRLYGFAGRCLTAWLTHPKGR